MTKLEFKQKMILFCENFDYKISKTYNQIIFKGFFENGLTAEDFEKAFQRMMYKPKGYGRPSLGDWIEACGKTSWIDKLQSVKTMKDDEVRKRYLSYIREDEPDLYKFIMKDVLSIEDKSNEKKQIESN